MDRAEKTENQDVSTRFFGRDCHNGFFGTGTETNRLVLFGVTITIALAGFVIMEESASYLTGSLLFQIYTGVRSLGVVMSLAAGLVMAVAFTGFIGAYWKARRLIKLFMVLTFILTTVQFLLSSFLYYAQDSDELRVLANSEFKKNWIKTIALVVEGEDVDGEVRSFIAQIQSQGQCCGYDEVNDDLQNPVNEIPCSFQEPCKEYFQEYVRVEMYPIFTGYLVLNFAVLLLLFVTLLTTCGLIPRPSPNHSDGAFYKAQPLLYL